MRDDLVSMQRINQSYLIISKSIKPAYQAQYPQGGIFQVVCSGN
jgi:hypothetical protein